MKKHALILLLLGLVVLEAVYEGMYDIGLKSGSKLIQCIWISSFFVAWAFFTFRWLYLLIYFNIRLLLFDYLYKAISGGVLCGTTSGVYGKYICPVLHTSIIMWFLVFTLIICIIRHYELSDQNY